MHNIRIERLWRDLTLGFGGKWKSFFQDLEQHDHLDHNLDAHIWLLHYLFLGAINTDALIWAGSWNEHVLSIRGERQRSPKDMFVFGMMQNGIRGFGSEEGEEDVIEDIDGYGVDWEDYEDDSVLAHHHAHNPFAVSDNPFQAHHPHHLSHVEIDLPNNPFTTAQTEFLEAELSQLPYRHSQVMTDRHLLWVSALSLCNEIVAV